VGVAIVVGAAAAGCFPAFDFSAAPEDGGPDAGGFVDATLGDGNGDGDGDGGASPLADVLVDADAGSAADAALPPRPVVILHTNIATQTGNAQQQHLVYATNSARFWLFYLEDDASLVDTQWSTDLVTWTPGASLHLPMRNAGEGRNLGVAYRAFGGADVVHVATSLHDDPKRVVWDTRAVITGDTIAFDAPTKVHDLDYVDNDPDAAYLAEAGTQGAGTACDPDGTGVAIGSDGRVYVATAWVSIPGCCSCDSNVAVSTATDDGARWDAGFVSPLTHFTVPGTTQARQVLSLGLGDMLLAWESADNQQSNSDQPYNVSWASETSGSWSTEYQDQPQFWIFPQDASDNNAPPQARNDWSICRIDDGSIHALRRRSRVGTGGDAAMTSQVFEHYRFNGSSWTYQASLPDDVGSVGSGVVLLTNGASLLAATIAGDGSDAIRYATWNGSTWSAWAPLEGADAGTARRVFLSGTGCADPKHPVLTWTEGMFAPYEVVAFPVGALMP
jgi:hypothetical protein